MAELPRTCRACGQPSWGRTCRTCMRRAAHSTVTRRRNNQHHKNLEGEAIITFMPEEVRIEIRNELDGEHMNQDPQYRKEAEEQEKKNKKAWNKLGLRYIGGGAP